MRTEFERLMSALLQAGVPADSVGLELFALSCGLLAKARGLEATAQLCERTADTLRHGEAIHVTH